MRRPDADLQVFFDSLSAKVQEKLKRGLRVQAERVRDEIKRMAAVGDTGKLAESVRVEDGRNDLELVVMAGGELTTKELRSGSGVDYDYALAVEFGTSKMDPNPFFYSTWRVMEDDVTAELEKVVAEALR